MQILRTIEENVRKYPERTAYSAGDACLTYAELWNAAQQTADRLIRQGTSPVVIYGHKETYVITSILACLIAGRTYIPVDSSVTPSERFRKIMEQSHAGLVITGEDFPVEPERKTGSCPDGLSGGVAYIIFTSGSTGTPKGVMITRDNLDNFASWICSQKPLCDYEACSVFNQASYSFDLSVADLYYALCGGHSIVAMNSGAGSEFAFFDDLKKCEVAVVTPTFIKLCLLDADFNEKHFDRLRCIYFCGEILEKKTVKQLFERFSKLEILNAYGPTEATSAISAVRITPDMLQDGLPLPVGATDDFATDVEIDDDEIVLSGPSVFPGYVGGAQSECMLSGKRRYRTGDMGFIRDSYLYCLGRKDSQIKYKGYRIELSEIEQSIRTLEGVDDCAVVAVRNGDGIVRMIKACVTGNKLDADIIRERLAEKLPAYMIPKTIRILDKLPVNSNCKTDRKLLEEL